MEKIDKNIFEHRYMQLMYITIQKLADSADSSEISFTTGLWKREEGYKRKAWQTARRDKLCLDTWDDVPSNIIVENVWNTMQYGERQNFLSKANLRKIPPEVFHDNHDKTAKIFYDLYKNENSSDEESFRKIVDLLGKKIHDPFSVVAYLFFLKDKDKYVPVRKDGFTKRLPKLGFPVSCVKTCTWENYQIILDVMKQLQTLLQEHLENVELIDAQSFFWMLRMVDEETPEYNPDDVDECETKVTKSYAEGRPVTQYYVKKYERDPRNRAAAIQIHGYKCMACGFDFKDVYGEELGKNFIEVHHIVPLSSRDEEIIVNPETDMVCLCANCHRMIHRRKNAIITLEELKQIIQEQKLGKQKKSGRTNI